MAKTDRQFSTKTIIELPEGERGFDADQVARYDKAKAMLLQTRFKLTPEQREGYHRTIAKIEANQLEWSEKAWRDASSAETIALAQARGEEPEQTKAGAVFFTSRDGLHTLYIAAAISQDEYDQGKRYRACYEARSGDVGSQMGELSNGGAHNNGAFVASRYERARMTNLIALIERQMPLQCLDEPTALQMFRAVVANGLTISSFGKGSAYTRHLRSFRRALTAAGITERAKRQADDAAERTRGAA